MFQLLDSELLKNCLNQHGKALLSLLAEKQICLDGKKLKGVSPRSRGTDGFFIVNAWVSENRLCIGQQRVENKSNEIDALVPLLKRMDIMDVVMSIDAIGCQTDVVQQIITQKGHYLRALKANQESLLEEVECAFRANRGRVADES